VRISLEKLLFARPVLLADGATGTNLFGRGLMSGDPPEFWNFDRPEEVRKLHQEFVDAGADIILTNTFGCNPHRLKLHNAQDRAFEIAKRAAEIAGEVAERSSRPIVVAGSVGPTGELFEPMGALTHDAAVASFTVQMEGLKAGGADIAWIETMSSAEEIRAAAEAAGNVGLPYTATCSFDTAGRTMMGMLPGDFPKVFDDLRVPPVGLGANCGVGASDILVSMLEMTGLHPHRVYIAKGNCGVPQFKGAEIHYSGTPELMGRYADLAVAAGVRIVGGCCGTTVEHLRAMRAAIDAGATEERPTIYEIIETTGPLVNSAPTAIAPSRERRRGRTRD
jgi:5-methyltetrahydrofolate--homocysteine methyltransferase